jgi:hypothetical protein
MPPISRALLARPRGWGTRPARAWWSATWRSATWWSATWRSATWWSATWRSATRKWTWQGREPDAPRSWSRALPPGSIPERRSPPIAARRRTSGRCWRAAWANRANPSNRANLLEGIGVFVGAMHSPTDDWRPRGFHLAAEPTQSWALMGMHRPYHRVAGTGIPPRKNRAGFETAPDLAPGSPFARLAGHVVSYPRRHLGRPPPPGMTMAARTRRPRPSRRTVRRMPAAARRESQSAARRPGTPRWRRRGSRPSRTRATSRPTSSRTAAAR